MKSRVMLKLKLVDAPCDELERVAILCRRAKNAAVEDWLLRQRGKPATRKQAGKGRNGKGLHPSTQLYHAITAAVPEIGSSTATALASAVWSNLNAKLDWRERVNGNGDGKVPKRADAILDYKARPPWTTETAIPAPNKYTSLSFEDDLTITVTHVTDPKSRWDLRVSLKGMPTGIKRLLRQIATGEAKLADSQIVKRTIRNGKDAWFFFLSCAMEAKSQPCEDVVATLCPQLPSDSGKQSDRPFKMDLPKGGCWYVGDGRYLLAQTMRLIGLRKMIGYRYRQGNGAGHGRQKIDRAVRLRVQQLKNVRDEFRRRLINGIIRQCERHQVGTLVYREPTGPVKDRCWFARNDLEFDWTRFVSDLKNAAARRGIAVNVKKLKIKEILNRDADKGSTVRSVRNRGGTKSKAAKAAG